MVLLKMLNQSNSSLQQTVDPLIKPLLERVLQAQKLGTFKRAIKIHEFKSKDGNKCDCVDLSVPYADTTLKWTVLFDTEFPELGPDFIFNDGNFLANPDAETLTDCVPSLANWNYCDHDSLLQVLKELLVQYKRHQINMLRLCCTQKLVFEYESLIEIVDDKDVEVITVNPCMDSMNVKFFIKLFIDFSKLPQKTKHHPQSDAVMLLVTFFGPEYCKAVPCLFLTKNIEEILGSPETLQLPPFLMHGILIDYVPTVKKFLIDKVDSLVSNFRKKKEFFSFLLLSLRGSIIEYDAVDFSKASFVIEMKDFHFLIHFQIPAGFPRERPEVVLQSAYHMDQSGKMLTHNVTKFCYNPQMDPKQMLQSILTQLEDKEVDSFQQFCTKKNRF